MARAEELFAAFDTYPTVLEDAAKSFIAKQTFTEEGLAVTMSKLRADGLTVEQLQPWLSDPSNLLVTLNSRMERTPLPDDEGHKIWHFKVNMPMVISNRSLITCYYHVELADGFTAVLHSSEGNEAQVAANTAEIGSNVIANNQITMTAYKPYDGGIEFKQVSCMDPAGMIPQFIKNAMAGRMANALLLIVDYLKDGTVPEPLF